MQEKNWTASPSSISRLERGAAPGKVVGGKSDLGTLVVQLDKIRWRVAILHENQKTVRGTEQSPKTFHHVYVYISIYVYIDICTCIVTSKSIREIHLYSIRHVSSAEQRPYGEC